MPSPLGAGEMRYNVLFFVTLRRIHTAVTSSVFFIALEGDEKSTFPKGEGFGGMW